MRFEAVLGLALCRILLANSIHYVDKSNLTPSPDGSEKNPFSSLQQALDYLKSGVFEIVLLGENATINASLSFPENSEYKIRGSLENPRNYYPLIFQNEEAYIIANNVNLTFEGIEILTENQTISQDYVTLSLTGGKLVFNKSLVQNVNNSGSQKNFRLVDSSNTDILIIDSQFLGLTEVSISSAQGLITVTGSIFADIDISQTQFMTLINLEANFKNNTFRRMNLDNRFINMDHMPAQNLKNFSFTDFIIQNINITKRGCFIFSGWLSVFEMRNGVIDNVSEKFKLEAQNALVPIIFEAVYVGKVISHTLMFKNFQLENFTILYYSGKPNYPELIIVKDIYIENCSKVSIFLSKGLVIVENVTLINTIYDANFAKEENNQKDLAPKFLISADVSLILRNIFLINQNGPLLSFSYVKKVYIEDCFVINSTISKEFLENEHKILQIKREDDHNSSEEFTVLIKNFYFAPENGDSSLQDFEVLSSSLIAFEVAVGRIKIQDSRWTNINLIGILGTSVENLEISNVIIEADPEIHETKVPLRKIFHFLNTLDIQVSNCLFLNLQKINLFDFSLENSVEIKKLPEIIFDHVKMINITAKFETTEINSPALFDFSDANILSLIFICRSSLFKNNKMITTPQGSGIILVEEPIKMQISLIDNIFEDNFSSGSSTILTATYANSDGFNNFELTGNIFSNNFCEGNGGLFSIFSSRYNITATNNVYKNISAQDSGGVGYVFSSEILFFEKNGTYSDIFTGESGGSWYFSSILDKKKSFKVVFMDTKFRKIKAFQYGGAIYFTQAVVDIINCVFEENQAVTSGGDIFVQTSSSLNIENTFFNSSSSAEGAMIYAEDIPSGIFTFNKVKVLNLESNILSLSLITINSGTFIIQDSQFYNISIPLFSLDGVNTTFKSIELRNISCKSEQPCILKGKSSSLTLLNTKIDAITSNADLLNLDSFDKIILSNIQISNIKKIDSSIDSTYFATITLSNTLEIQNSSFMNLEVSGLFVKQSNVLIQSTLFSNRQSESRILHQSRTLEVIDEVLIRFIIMESCNSSISNVTFLDTLENSKLKTGALQILGNKGNYDIRGSRFQENRAVNGGAISTEGGIDSITIYNCEFTDNRATEKGGCLYFSDQKVRNSIKISQTQFNNNKAEKGGCIYLGDQNALLDTLNFTENTATEGGAIASTAKGIDNLSIIIIQKNNFNENSAILGSALMAFGKMNFDITNSVFSQNMAQYGQYITSQPYRLKLQIYEFDETFLFLNNITPQIIFSHYATKHVFNSEFQGSDSNNTYLRQKSGVSPNYLFVFRILDELKNNTATLNPSSLTISIKNSIFEGDLQPSLLGKAVFTFEANSEVLFIDKSLSVRGTTNTNITLFAEFSYKDLVTDQDVFLPTVEWKVQIIPCSPGEIYDKVNTMCLACADGTFSYEDPYTAQSCKQCSGPVLCKGSDIVYPQPGYWQMSKGSDNVIACFNEEACLGGEKDGGTAFSFSGFCKEGYEGIACTNCSPGFAKFGTSQECANCKTEAGYYVKFTAYFSIQMIAVIILVKSLLIKKISNEGKKMLATSILKIAIIKIMIDFIHTLNLTMNFILRWPKAVDIFLYVVTKFAPDIREGFSLDCFIALRNNQNIFFIKLLSMILLPFLIIICAIGIFVAHYKAHTTKALKNSQLFSDIRVTSIAIIYFFQPYIAKAILQLFNCYNFGSTLFPNYYMIEDTHLECWSSKHLGWALGLGVPSLIIWLLLPILMLCKLIKDIKGMPYEKFKNQYGWIFVGYESSSAYWEVIIFLRKLVLIVLSVLIKNEYLKVYFGFLSTYIVYYMHVNFMPFSYPELNMAEQLSLCASALIFYSGLFFTTGETDSNTISNLLMSVNTTITTIFFGYCLLTICKSFKINFKITKQKASETNSPILVTSPTGLKSENNKLFVETYPKYKSKVETSKSLSALPLKDLNEEEQLKSPTKRIFSFDMHENEPRNSNQTLNLTWQSPTSNSYFIPKIQKNKRDYSEVSGIDFFTSNVEGMMIMEERSPEDKQPIDLVKRSVLRKEKIKKVQQIEVVDSPCEMTRELEEEYIQDDN